MTWHGQQGFRTPIEAESFKVKDFGVFGNEHTERGLTCKFSQFSDHHLAETQDKMWNSISVDI